MQGLRKIVVPIVLGVIAVGCAGCRQGTSTTPADNPTPNNPNASKADNRTKPAFLDQKKQIPSGLEWNRSIDSKTGGEISYRVASQGPFAVTIVKDAGYQAMKGNAKINKSDIILTVDSKEKTYEGKATVPPGTTWFIIENQAGKEVEFHLQCFAP